MPFGYGRAVNDFPTSTFGATHPDRDRGPRRVLTRRIAYGVSYLLLTGVVASAVLDGTSEIDVWGVSTDRVRASGGGYELEVRYPTVTRPALATPFDIVVRRESGFVGPVDVALDPDWLAMWDFQALYPEPSSQVATPTEVIMTFDPPDGDELRIFLDARIQPAQQSGRDGFVALVDQSRTVAIVTFNTAVRP